MRTAQQKDIDMDCFIKKVDAVNVAISDMKDGKINPEDVRIEGIPTDEERKQREIQRIAAEEKLAKEIYERNEKLKVQEKELWWRNAKLMCGSNEESGRRERTVLGSSNDKSSSSSEIVIMKNKNKLHDMYSTEYSRWNRWEPSDPATRDENEGKNKSEEKIKVVSQSVTFEKVISARMTRD